MHNERVFKLNVPDGTFFLNLLDFSHVSICQRAHRTSVQRGMAQDLKCGWSKQIRTFRSGSWHMLMTLNFESVAFGIYPDHPLRNTISPVSWF